MGIDSTNHIERMEECVRYHTRNNLEGIKKENTVGILIDLIHTEKPFYTDRDKCRDDHAKGDIWTFGGYRHIQLPKELSDEVIDFILNHPKFCRKTEQVEIALSGNDLIVGDGLNDIVVSKELLYEILSCQDSQNIYKDRLKKIERDGCKNIITIF